MFVELELHLMGEMGKCAEIRCMYEFRSSSHQQQQPAAAAEAAEDRNCVQHLHKITLRGIVCDGHESWNL